MASSSSLPAASAAAPNVSNSAAGAICRRRLSATVSAFPLPSESKKLLRRPLKGLSISRNQSVTAKAQLNEVLGGSSNHVASLDAKVKVPVVKQKDGDHEKSRLPSAPLSEEAISEFFTQVANIVKLVDSRDIVELQLKQLDCELVIRKKEALPQPQSPAPVVMMQAPPSHVAMASPVPAPPLPPPATAALPSPASAALPAPSPAPKATKSSHPPLKSPMAGTFYRSPGPGLPQFVKIGDKVNKGQVLCIIEAMKLMNEIEADQAGTIVDILLEDGKPVGIEQPIFLIEP